MPWLLRARTPLSRPERLRRGAAVLLQAAPAVWGPDAGHFHLGRATMKHRVRVRAFV